jgi:hypothetical protein
MAGVGAVRETASIAMQHKSKRVNVYIKGI